MFHPDREIRRRLVDWELNAEFLTSLVYMHWLTYADSRLDAVVDRLLRHKSFVEWWQALADGKVEPGVFERPKPINVARGAQPIQLVQSTWADQDLPDLLVTVYTQLPDEHDQVRNLLDELVAERKNGASAAVVAATQIINDAQRR